MQLVMVAEPRYVNDDDYTGGFSRADIAGLLDSLESNHSAGRPRWRRSSWATPTGRSSARS